MTTKQSKKPFKNEFQKELAAVKLNVQRIDKEISVKFYSQKRELINEIRSIDERLEELNPEWCEVWRLRRRKQKAERKLKQYSY